FPFRRTPGSRCAAPAAVRPTRRCPGRWYRRPATLRRQCCSCRAPPSLRLFPVDIDFVIPVGQLYAIVIVHVATPLTVDVARLARPEKVSVIGNLGRKVILVGTAEIGPVLVVRVLHQVLGPAPTLPGRRLHLGVDKTDGGGVAVCGSLV